MLCCCHDWHPVSRFTAFTLRPRHKDRVLLDLATERVELVVTRARLRLGLPTRRLEFLERHPARFNVRIGPPENTSNRIAHSIACSAEAPNAIAPSAICSPEPSA